MCCTLIAATTLFTTGFSPVLCADDQAKNAPVETVESSKSRPYPFRGKIGKIDKEARSFTIPGKEKSRTFYLDAETKIQKHGKPATLDDAKVGDEVGGTVLPDASGKLMLRSVRFGPKPATDKTAAKPKKEKENDS